MNITQEKTSYLRNAKHFLTKREQRHFFQVNTFDHKDNFRPELKTTGDEPIPPFIANRSSHGILGKILVAVKLLHLCNNSSFALAHWVIDASFEV